MEGHGLFKYNLIEHVTLAKLIQQTECTYAQWLQIIGN
jgi:hypothetical protein